MAQKRKRTSSADKPKRSKKKAAPRAAEPASTGSATEASATTSTATEPAADANAPVEAVRKAHAEEAAKAATARGSTDSTAKTAAADGQRADQDKDQPASQDEELPVSARLRRAFVGGVRSIVVPAARGYAPTDHCASDNGQEKPAEHLDEAELGTLKRAGMKLLVEAGELGLQAFPPLEDGAEVHRAKLDPETGRYGEPTLAYLVSAVQAYRALRGSPDQAKELQAGERAALQEALPDQAKAAVAPLPRTNRGATATPSYVPASARVRRSAPVREVEMTRTLRFSSGGAVGPAAALPPRSASAQPRVRARGVTAAAGSRLVGQPMRTVVQPRALSYSMGPQTMVDNPSMTNVSVIATPTWNAGAQPSYGGSSLCGCGTTSSMPTNTQLAHYDENGECDVKIFDIDCETRARLALCFRRVICDFLLCVGDELCTGSNFQAQGTKQEAEGGSDSGQNPSQGNTLLSGLLRCLGTAACSAVQCIPEALCPPPPQLLAPCQPLPCSFAVEEQTS